MNKNEGIARILSVVFPGLGQIYLGKWVSGILFIAFWLWGLIVGVIPRFVHFILGTATLSEFVNILIAPLIIWILNLISINHAINDRRKIKPNTSDQSL